MEIKDVRNSITFLRTNTLIKMGGKVRKTCTS